MADFQLLEEKRSQAIRAASEILPQLDPIVVQRIYFDLLDELVTTQLPLSWPVICTVRLKTNYNFIAFVFFCSCYTPNMVILTQRLFTWSS